MSPLILRRGGVFVGELEHGVVRVISDFSVNLQKLWQLQMISLFGCVCLQQQKTTTPFVR